MSHFSSTMTKAMGLTSTPLGGAMQYFKKQTNTRRDGESNPCEVLLLLHQFTLEVPPRLTNVGTQVWFAIH